MFLWESRGWIRVQYKDWWESDWNPRRYWFFDPRSGYRGGIVMFVVVAFVMLIAAAIASTIMG